MPAQQRGRQAMDRTRLFAWGYFALFILVVISGLMPQLQDAQGRQFGLFTLDFYDHSLHLASGIWAGIAAWLSRRASRGYFRLFGPLYFLDGVLGLFTGSGYLDLGIFLYGPVDLPLTTRFFANLPHLVIGGFALWVGYVYARAPE
jgi:hypothetical protein